MILHLYFARKFLTAVLAVFGVFFILLVLVGMMEQVRRFSAAALSFSEILAMTLLSVPTTLYGILPLVIILATLSLFLGLARTSELVVTRASGRSALRSLVAPVIVALVLGAFSVAVLNPMVAATQRQYEVMANRFNQGSESVLSISREGLWLRQGGPEGQTVIRAANADLDGSRLFDVTFISFDTNGLPASRIEAEVAELVPGRWDIAGAKEWTFTDGGNPERDAVLRPEMSLNSELTQDGIRDSFGTPSAIPIWELADFIERLERAGFSARQHRVWLQMELAQPLVLAAMVFVGAAFTLRHTRFGRTSLMVLLALGFGFALYFLRNFAQILGENGQIPIALAAWSPPIAAILLSLGMLLHLEDG